jgi:hypothetical protein
MSAHIIRFPNVNIAEARQISMRRLRPIDFRVVFSRSVVGTQVYELAGESRTRSL